MKRSAASFVALVVLVLLALVSSCAGCPKSGGTSQRLSVAVSIFPVYDLVRRVAGPDADVSLIVPAGRSEHGFEPAPGDVEVASRCKVGVMVGLGLDPWMEKLMAGAGPKARIVKVGDRVPTLEQEPDKASMDPHVWLDPERARLIVRAVAEELGKADAPHAVAYRKRATDVDESLAALDKELEARTKALPARGFVTFHGAFGYYAERYKLDVLAVVEPTAGTPPTEAHLAKVRAVIRERRLRALFSEPQLDARPAKVLADEAKIALGVLDPLGGGPETDSYEKMIRFDTAQLEQFLR